MNSEIVFGLENRALSKKSSNLTTINNNVYAGVMKYVRFRILQCRSYCYIKTTVFKRAVPSCVILSMVWLRNDYLLVNSDVFVEIEILEYAHGFGKKRYNLLGTIWYVYLSREIFTYGRSARSKTKKDTTSEGIR